MQSKFVSRVNQKRRSQRRLDAAAIMGALVLCFCFCVWLFLKIPPVQRVFLYPYPYRVEVEAYSAEYRVESALIVALMRTESKFKEDVQSHRGAVGLMQLMPDTAHWVAGQLGEEDFSERELYEVKRNIRYGVWYYAYLERVFYGNPVLALAAYNAGRGNVEDWMRHYEWDANFSDIEEIPYAETKEYVRRVLKNQQKYRSLYYGD